jgi:hypothetical protein
MNERIKELAEQACFDEIGKDYSLYFNLTKEKVEKFAELIVRECAEFTHPVTRKFIFEHFGVEE